MRLSSGHSSAPPRWPIERISGRSPPGSRQMLPLAIRRLTDHGKVGWDKWLGNTWKRETSAVDAERVSELQRVLDVIDSTWVPNKKMGPYHIYMDNSVVLQIRMNVCQEQVTFSGLNP